jgi:outer membrane protein assembly factor BamB
MNSFLAGPAEISKRVVRFSFTFRTMIIAAFVSFVFNRALPAESLFPIQWKRDMETFLESAATVADLTGDGRERGIVAGREELFAVEEQGDILWHWRTKGRFMTYPAVLTRPGKPSLIYAADNTGLLSCLDGTGNIIWQAQLKGPSSWSASVVCDLEGDKNEEVIQTDETGAVSAFTALTGKLLWRTTIKGIPVSPAVGDLDGDGKLEIILATGQGWITALGSMGQVLWERNVGGSSQSWATSAPVLFADGDGRTRVAAASNDGKIFCLDATGGILWWRPTRGAVASTISIGDLDLNGRADICLTTQLGVIHRFDETGRMLWEIDMQGRSLAPGAIIDLQGDEKLEYVLCTQNGLLLALNEQGDFIHRYQFNNRTINVTPAFGQLSTKSPGLEMLITGGESGVLFCLQTPAATNAAAHWKCYRGDPRNSGSWFALKRSEVAAILPVNLRSDELMAGQDLKFIVQNPNGKTPLTATASCIRPDGSRQTSTTTVLGKRGELAMPLQVLVPGDYKFNWSVTDTNGHLIASGQRALFLQPFANERALVARTLTALESVAEEVRAILPLSTAALQREKFWIEADSKDMARLHEEFTVNDPETVQNAFAKTERSTKRAQRGLAIAEVIRKASSLGVGTSLVAFEGTLWENRKVDEQLPASAANPLRIVRRAVPSEHEPISLNVFNVTDRELLVRVQHEPLTNGAILTVHRSIGVPTSLGEISWDALPELDESGTVTIPSFQSREIWLDLDLRELKSGDHKINLRLQALNGAGVLDGPTGPATVPPPESKIEILLKVAPFAMAPSGEFQLCTWAAPEKPALPDLLAHGNNVFPMGLPTPVYSQGRLTGVDYSRLDPILERLKGKDVILLLQGMPSLQGETSSDTYRNGLKTFLDHLVTHMAQAGLDTNHFALYPFDEPGGVGWNAVNQLVDFGKRVHQTHPGVMIYMDGGGELPMFEAMASCIDIWCPSIYMLAENSEVMRVVRKSGKKLWSYNCAYGFSRPVGPNLKNMNIVADYRAAAPFAFRHGATGIGFWCYNLGGDPWGRMDMEYMLVYPGRTKPVTSRRWEAVREGIEDYRILAALQKHLVSASGGPPASMAQTKIAHLIEVSLPGLVDQSFEEMTRGLGRSVIDASNNDATIEAFRREMMECVDAVSDSSSHNR